ncbi:hypothetical protein PHMEG_00040961 [Phytophthora megakarya]|uniref:Uncharacterized protein n=1 Tax=Phytophthora megakarya TaxID=4795 RepID=A0A225UCP9_9STRA|nr:hypothetical protein PHMEG_00040961 [Phytophthora megakarya]
MDKASMCHRRQGFHRGCGSEGCSSERSCALVPISRREVPLRAVVNFLVYARSEREYNKHRRYLKLLTSIGLEREVGEMDVADNPNYHTVLIETYFSKNWDNCRDFWCSYKRQNAVTLGNNTNNRLESSWKHMEEVVKSSMSLDQCLATIIFYQNQTETLL